MYGRTLIRTAESTNVGASSYKIGALVKYRCERGYKVIGEPLSTCEDNGQWSGDVPQCICKCAENFRTHVNIVIRIIFLGTLCDVIDHEKLIKICLFIKKNIIVFKISFNKSILAGK